MELAHFYHCFVGGDWVDPLTEHMEALGAARFPMCRGRFLLVGPEKERSIARRLVGAEHCRGEYNEGNEYLILAKVREYAQTHDGAVLYAHTKGAATVEPFRDRWRRSMTTRVVSNWRANLALLEDHDAVGCHWLTEDQFPGMFGMTLPPFFGGNFWMARCDYLRTLPPCPSEPRYEAERWIGLGNPRVVDLLPGWPHDNRWPELCG